MFTRCLRARGRRSSQTKCTHLWLPLHYSGGRKARPRASILGRMTLPMTPNTLTIKWPPGSLARPPATNSQKSADFCDSDNTTRGGGKARPWESPLERMTQPMIPHTLEENINGTAETTGCWSGHSEQKWRMAEAQAGSRADYQTLAQCLHNGYTERSER